MGNRHTSGMKLVPVSPSACDSSTSSEPDTSTSKATDIDVRNLGEYMIKRMKKYGNSVAMVILPLHFFLPVCLSVCLFVFQSVCLSVCLSGWLAGWLAVCLSV